jgi:hypothetical protein
LHSRFLDAALLDPAHDILRRRGKELRSRMFESCWILAGARPGSIRSSSRSSSSFCTPVRS